MSIEAANEVTTRSWAAAKDDKRVALLKDVQTAAVEAAAREKNAADALARNEQLVRDTKSKVATRADSLASLQKTLGILARNDKLRDSFKFYDTFFDEVKKSIDDAKKASVDAAKVAAAPKGAGK